MSKSEVLSREDTVTEADDEEILDGPEALLIAAEAACVGGVCTLPATQRLQIRVTISLKIPEFTLTYLINNHELYR